MCLAEQVCPQCYLMFWSFVIIILCYSAAYDSITMLYKIRAYTWWRNWIIIVLCQLLYIIISLTILILTFFELHAIETYMFY